MFRVPFRVFLIGALAVAVSSLQPALADREPTAEERLRIETALRAMAFTEWEGIELEAGMWEIDDAIGPGGEEFDLKLRPGTLEIVEREPD
ncbi:MAG: PepSY domain-containing protein [Acetobacteraceae bacterium]